MPALLLLFIVTSGFIYLHTDRYHFFKLHRHDGQYLYLKSATYGILFHLISAIIIIVVFGFNYFELYTVKKDINSKIENFSVIIFCSSVSLFSQLLAYIFPKVSNFLSAWYLRKYDIISFDNLIVDKLLRDSPMDLFLLRSQIALDTVMLSMKNRKVYVGKILSTGEPSEFNGADQEIKILPAKSGYRDPNSLEVTFTTDYELTDVPIVIILRQEEISSATKFDFSAYTNINKKPKFKGDTDISPNSK